MNRLLAVAVLAAFALTVAACSTPNGMQAGAVSTQPGGAGRPWDRAGAIARATEADISKGGIRAIRTHVADLEDALAHANEGYGAASASTNPAYVLTDGPAEALAGLLLAQKSNAAPGVQTVAIPNPYPIVSFFLGTYYNEVGMSQDALRVLDAGLALPTPIMGSDMGQTRPLILSERGIALAALKRWDDSLASYDRALAIRGLVAQQRGILLRGRGFALIELGRLDDAEQAYRESLMVEPNNPRARQELTYIERLRAGGPMAPVELFTRMPPSR